MNIGTTSINILKDGTFLLDGGTVFGQIPKSEWETQIKPDRRNRVRLGLNCVLIMTPEKNILVDTGAGSKRTAELKEKFGLNGNKLMRNLKSHGLTARDIDVVVLTQLQFAHSGGCTKLDRTGAAVPIFPKAEYVVQEECWNEAINPNERFETQFFEDDYAPLADRDMIRFLDGEEEIIPGVTVSVADGPAKGHQVVFIERGSERIVLAGDLIPTPYHLPLTYIPADSEFPNETFRLLSVLVQLESHRHLDSAVSKHAIVSRRPDRRDRIRVVF